MKLIVFLSVFLVSLGSSARETCRYQWDRISEAHEVNLLIIESIGKGQIERANDLEEFRAAWYPDSLTDETYRARFEKLLKRQKAGESQIPDRLLPQNPELAQVAHFIFEQQLEPEIMLAALGDLIHRFRSETLQFYEDHPNEPVSIRQLHGPSTWKVINDIAIERGWGEVETVPWGTNIVPFLKNQKLFIDPTFFDSKHTAYSHLLTTLLLEPMVDAYFGDGQFKRFYRYLGTNRKTQALWDELVDVYESPADFRSPQVFFDLGVLKDIGLTRLYGLPGRKPAG